MKNKVLATLLTLGLVLTAWPVSLAQTNVSAQRSTDMGLPDWQGLRDLKPGKKVLVEFKSGVGDPVERKFVSATGSTLTVSDAGYPFRLQQRDIQRVYQLKGRWSRGKAARIAGGIGLLVGTMIGTGKVVNSSDPENPAAFVGFFIGALAGAGMGALLGGKRKGKLLYEAK